MKKLLFLSTIYLIGCGDPKPVEAPMPAERQMSTILVSNVSTTTFNAAISKLQSQITACNSKAFLQDSTITALQKQVNINQNQMYSYALEFYTRTDELYKLVRVKDTAQIIGNVTIDSISPHYKIITLP